MITVSKTINVQNSKHFHKAPQKIKFRYEILMTTVEKQEFLIQRQAISKTIANSTESNFDNLRSAGFFFFFFLGSEY